MTQIFKDSVKVDAVKLAPNNTLLFFAPIAEWPLSHGGSIRSVQFFKQLCSVLEMDGTFIGSNFDCQLSGDTYSLQMQAKHEKSKNRAALGSLLNSDHYIKQKQLSKEVCARFDTAMSARKPVAVFMNYLYSALLIDKVPSKTPIYLDTHNNDYEWFENFKRSSKNPLVTKICNNSLEKTEAYLKALDSRVSLLHVTKNDADIYRVIRNDLRHYVVPNGCVISPRNSRPDYPSHPTQLLFVGSLSSQMNIDALVNFHQHYWETLKPHAQLTVLGSRPTDRIVELCQKNGWKLLADADDKTLDQAYELTHFAILPFNYGAGSKLKLAEACGRGVPILSTPAAVNGVNNLPGGVFVSDAPEQWKTHILGYDFDQHSQTGLIEYGKANSWYQIAENFSRELIDQELRRKQDTSLMEKSRAKQIFIHDFGGYPFILEASRQLARLGYKVEHHFVSMTHTDRDTLERYDQSERNLRVFRHTLSDDYSDIKYNFTKRFHREYNYGTYLSEVISQRSPDVVISSNAPNHIQTNIQRAAENTGASFIPWVQDFYSMAVASHFADKIPLLGNLIGKIYMQWERDVLKSSSHVAVISDDFNPQLIKWGISKSRLHTIRNWANLSDIPVLPKKNEWAMVHGLDDKFCFIYSGTMGLKHNPDTLIELAQSFITETEVRIVIIGEGAGIEYIKNKNLPNVRCLPFQPSEQFAEVLATADVLTALLEPSAGHYSVPSKVLSYLCAQRPILLSVPRNNLASNIVLKNRAGKVAAPHDTQKYLKAAHTLYKDSRLRKELGGNARQYAEKHFDPKQIGKEFDAIIQSAA